MKAFRRLLWICILAPIPMLASSELWSVVQGIAPDTQIEVQIKDVKHRGTLSAVTIRKVKVQRRIIIGGLIGLAAGIAASAPFGELGRNEGTFDPATAIGAGAAIGFGVGACVGALAALAPGYYTVYESARP
jgi:hypothetical protein